MNRNVAIFTCVVMLLLTGCRSKSAPGSGKASEEHEKTSEKSNEVEMLLPAQQHVGLQVTPVGVVSLNEYLKAAGTVQPIDSLVGEVSPLARGRIASVRIKVGDRVHAGETLALFDNLDAIDLSAQEQSARAEIAKLSAQLVPAVHESERSRRLADIGAAPEKDVETSKAEEQGIRASIEAQQAVLRGLQQRLHRYGMSSSAEGSLTSLKAPFVGVVTKATASAGDVAEPGQELFTVANLSRVWVQAEVYEKDLGRIRLGQNAIVHVDTYPDETFAGRVTYISDVLDPQTRTARVRCEVLNSEMRLKADMYATVDLPTKFNKQGIAVPTDALQQIEGKAVVFVQKSPTRFEVRPVEKGHGLNSMTEITYGLSVGERVVVHGAFQLKSIVVSGEMGDND